MKLIHKSTKLLAKGFTLAELVISVAITVILLTVLIALANVATTSLETATASVERSDSAQSYLDNLTTDLQSVFIKRGSEDVWFHVGEGLTKGAKELNKDDKDDKIKNAEKIPNNAALVFFTVAGDRYDGNLGGTGDGGGDISIVSYEIRYLDVNKTMASADTSKTTKTFNGYRSLVEPKDAYGVLFVDEATKEEVQTIVQGSGSGLLSGDLNGARDVVCDGLFELTCIFNVEYFERKQPTATEPDPDTIRKSQVIMINPLIKASEGVGTYAKITGNGFSTDAVIGQTGATISGLQAKSITVVLNVMDKSTQKLTSLREISAADILKKCRTYTTTVQLPSL